MPGGSWSTQNKVRPGAYVNMRSSARASTEVGERGIVTMPVTLTWGEFGKLIPVYGSDLLDGGGRAKAGVTLLGGEAPALREALKYARVCLVWRLGSGAAAARGGADGWTAAARCAGTLGNRIAVTVREGAGGKYDVITYLAGSEKHRQSVADAVELTDNDWVVFSGSGALSPRAGVPLTGGTDGDVRPEEYLAYFEEAARAAWNVMALPTRDIQTAARAADFIKAQRENAGRKRQAVVCGYPEADSEGVISVSQGYVNRDGETLPPEALAAAVAGMTAAAQVNQSNTYRVLEGATEIVGALRDEETEEALRGGRFVLSYRQDGAVVVEQDINTLHTFTPERGAVFAKNRVVRALDGIAEGIALKFERGYIGRVRNDDAGRLLFRADIIGYLAELTRMGAVQNFDAEHDIDVRQGEGIDAVVVDLAVQPVDSMEKLYMTVNVG